MVNLAQMTFVGASGARCRHCLPPAPHPAEGICSCLLPSCGLRTKVDQLERAVRGVGGVGRGGEVREGGGS